MTPQSHFKENLAAKANKVEQYLSKWPEMIPNTPKRLQQAMCYSLEAGGKRLRPAICMASAALHGMQEDLVLPFACAIEMIHTYSLIHDDLPAMDDDDLRRGKPSNHKQFDEATAILAGDGLLTDAFWLTAGMDLPPDRILKAIRELAYAAGSSGMAGGQMLDMIYTGKDDIELKEIAHMQALKTGAIIRASATCGAILAGADEKAVKKMEEYGSSLGAAFQIADDILDLTSTTQELGKPARSDEKSGKNTYPSRLGLERSRSIAAEEVNKAISALPAVPEAQFLEDLARYAVKRSS